MAAKAKAAVLTAPRTIEIQEFPLPEIGEDDALLRVETTGVCGADWPAYNGVLEIGELSRTPLILGHETVGRIERIGPEAARRWQLKAGDRVAIEEYIPCGHCLACLGGRYHTCTEKWYGFTSLDLAPQLWGGYGEYMYLHPFSLVHKMADSVPTEIAALFLPLSNGIRWVQEVGGAKIGSTVAIIGPGPQGLASVVAAKEAGARCTIVLGRSADKDRMAVARELGADYTIDVQREDPVQRVREITNGAMADTVVNATAAAPEATQLGVDVAGHGATVVVAGLAEGGIGSFAPDTVLFKELTIKGIRGHTFREIKKAISVLESGKYPFHAMCTHTFPIAETEQAIRTVGHQGDPSAIHVSVTAQ